MNEKIVFLNGDITTVVADAIVNPANTEMLHGGGLAGVLAKAGGKQIQQESDQIGSIPLGEAAVTSAGKLHATYLIHAASMPLGGRTDEASLRSALTNTYKRAAELDIHTIAIPSVGTGYGQFPMEHAAMIQMEQAADFLKHHPAFEKIQFVLHSDRDMQAFQSAYQTLFNGQSHETQ